MSKRLLFSYALLTFSFLSFPVLAVCTASPDCIILGYDKTSCNERDSVLKCPFDSTKLKCIPLTCETIGKKTCGDMCVTDSFAGCCSDSDCSDGQMCGMENNICYNLAKVGDIYYSDGSYSTDLDNSKVPIGVVGYISNSGKNGVVVAKVQSSQYWSREYFDLTCIDNLQGADVGGEGGPNPELRVDFNGKANTDCIMERVASVGRGKYPAGEYCNGLLVEGISGWYLPASGEMYDILSVNLSPVNAGLSKISGAAVVSENTYHWSSTEFRYDDAWRMRPHDGNWVRYGKNYGAFSVRCMLGF